jgi:hypothetical protein
MTEAQASPEKSAMQRCIEHCLECRRVCYEMAMTHCLREGGPHVEQAHLSLMINCATMCQTAADFMLSESPLHPEVCRVCADVCASCAQSCARLAGMEACEQACRRCESTCSEMASTMITGYQKRRVPDTGVPGGPRRQGM